MESPPGDARVLIVVATLGQRPEFLRQTLASIRAQSEPADVVIVAPESAASAREAADEFGCMFAPDPGSLAAAINLGAASTTSEHDFVTWLNDDDLLEPGALAATIALLDAESEAVVAFGACRYIDTDNRELWISRAGPWAVRILGWGPDLIPQPGMLVRADAWRAVGGLDESFRFAFDLDLLLRLRAVGRLRDTGVIVSSFRWHGDSLTVGDRRQSLAESERAKRRALGPVGRRAAWLWEGPVRLATKAAAREVGRRASRLSVQGR